jgi:hypothetical protein
MEGPISFCGYKEQESNLIFPEHDDDDDKSQQDAHVIEFILSDNCSTYFGRYHHPSSGTQNNCNYSIW